MPVFVIQGGRATCCCPSSWSPVATLLCQLEEEPSARTPLCLFSHRDQDRSTGPGTQTKDAQLILYRRHYTLTLAGPGRRLSELPKIFQLLKSRGENGTQKFSKKETMKKLQPKATPKNQSQSPSPSVLGRPAWRRGVVKHHRAPSPPDFPCGTQGIWGTGGHWVQGLPQVQQQPTEAADLGICELPGSRKGGGGEGFF